MKTSVLEILTPHYIIDDHGKRTGVILDPKTFDQLMEELEDLYDVRQAEKILAKGKAEEGHTLEEIEKSLRKKCRK